VNVKVNGHKTLEGRKLYIHPMTQAGARMIAAVFRSEGVDASILPPSDAETLELGAMYSSGEECFPEKITIGDYLKVTRKEGFDPAKTAFLMPASNGPCRFGQYWPLLDTVLKRAGLEEVLILSPSSSTGYGDIAKDSNTFFRMGWLGLIASDILRKMLLKTRPYERKTGTTDEVYEQGLQRAERILERPGMNFGKRRELLADALRESRDEFRAIPADYRKGKPLIAILGEIFCRHNRFANENMIRKLEEHGAETWMADVGEWVFYTDWSRMDNLARKGKRFSKTMAVAMVKRYIMKRDEHALIASFHEDFVGYEEPSDTVEVVELGEDYLPARGALGEMALSLGRSGYCYRKGVDGIVDISPFSCMNGIVSEAVYPSFSRDHDDLPCRVFYYDGVNRDLDRDIGIFMELVKGYMARKKVHRVYPAVFRE
jgi:predicted nucleotide-binding protein (sugar kinase/HSP70/actin superfamily)